MTLRSIAGLVGLNLFVLGVGSGVLWGIRGWRSWTEVARLSGVAYLLGISAFYVLLTVELVLGIPFGPAAFVTTGLGLVVGGYLTGRSRRREKPDLEPHTSAAFGSSLVGAVFVGAMIVYFQSLFRAGRLSDFGWDVWASWVPKAKGIYYSGGIDPEFFASLPGAAYPPGIPALHAAAFYAMGSADAVTLHLQYWFLAVGFAVAVAGLLSTRVRATILLPLLLLVVLMPDLRNRATDLHGDIPLGYLVAAGALLMLLWIEDRRTWKLAAATVLLGGAMMTKREGILFAVCVVAAALAATFRERRGAWPRIAVAGIVAFALSLPWRVWFTLRDIQSDAPEAGYLGIFSNLDRAWPSLELVVDALFDYDLWLVVPTLGVAAAVLAYFAGARREGVFAVAFFATSVIGCAWTFWTNPSIELATAAGVVNRVVGTPILVTAALTPLLLELAWRGRADAPDGTTSPRTCSSQKARARVAVAIVVVALAVYPAVTLAGGKPRFPSAYDCVQAPVEGQRVLVVFGYRDTYPEAILLRNRALAVGFLGMEAAQDGCGRVRVFVDDVPTIAVGEEVIREAGTVDLEPTLEFDSDE